MHFVSKKSLHFPFLLILLNLILVSLEEIREECDFEEDSNRFYELKIFLRENSSKVLIDNCHKRIDTESDHFRVHVTGVLSEISQESFLGIENTTELDISNVGLEEIKPGTFSNLEDLKHLTLFTNKLRVIRKGIFENLNVKLLDFTENLIDVLEESSFRNLYNLSQLDLGDNQLKEIRSGVFTNISLLVLGLENNIISTIEKDAFVDILPEERLGIIVIHLGHNKIESIDRKAFKSDYTIYLYLEDNAISVIRPGDFGNMPNLEFINLDNNKLKEIPNGVFNNTNLRFVFLSKNEISSIESEAFDEMKDLEILKLDKNKIKVWDSNWFRGSWTSEDEYKKIDFAFNEIEEIPEDAFGNFPRRKFSFNFDYNRIIRIADSAFKNWKEIYTLTLKDNEMDEWSDNILKDLKKVHNLYVSGNKFVCPKNIEKVSKLIC